MLPTPPHLSPHIIHVWPINLTPVPEHLAEQRSWLSPDEIVRANRFHQPLHQQQFTVARATLRHILGSYLQIPPQQIQFGYTDYHKPYLLSANPQALQFNLAHSHDLAVYAVTLQYAIGIDIEKMTDKHDSSKIAQRFFSPEENLALSHLPLTEQTTAFYQLWTRKEALLKAVGKGLSLPLASFTVPLQTSIATVQLENANWTLIPLAVHPEYQAALASNQSNPTIQIIK